MTAANTGPAHPPTGTTHPAAHSPAAHSPAAHSPAEGVA